MQRTHPGRLWTAAALVVMIAPSAPSAGEEPQRPAAESLTAKESLGQRLFFEQSLSSPPGQACSACHDPQLAFADPDTGLPVSRGARPGLYGNRNDQPVAYAAFVPPRHRDPDEGHWVGGLFWDGRANTLAEQAQGPPLNPLEMANPDVETIGAKLRSLEYARLFADVYGQSALADPQRAFDHMADAIAAYERTAALSPFDSKFDHWLRGDAELSAQERRGRQVFESEDRGNCAACHPSQPAKDGSPPLFTDFTYDNLGVPPNPENPFYLMAPQLNPGGFAFVDLGLGVVVKDPAQNGKFRVPTLRNVALTAPYMHNGVFKTLFQVVAFYNTRDVARWPAPEVGQNVNREELGDLRLTNQELEDLVAFLQTLTDGWRPASPRGTRATRSSGASSGPTVAPGEGEAESADPATEVGEERPRPVERQGPPGRDQDVSGPTPHAPTHGHAVSSEGKHPK